MEIKLILIALAVLSVAGAGGYIVHRISSNAIAGYQQKVDVAEAKAQAAADKEKQIGENHIVDMSAAFDAGAESAKGVAAKIAARQRPYVQNLQGAAFTQCDAGADFVQLVNYSSANMRAAAVAGFSDAAMPATGAIAGRQAGNTGGSNVSGQVSSGSVGAVRPPARSTDSPNPVPGLNLPTHPRPKPVPIR
jgi:hypothetical protein